ncbi:hypothetical protein BH24BAC1_BH24BAC1_41020 [soil metagenome]
MFGESAEESEFVTLLEKHPNQISWWYKNTVGSQKAFAVPYQNSKGEEALFYVDFVVRFAKGVTGLFDTKTKDSDPEAPAKHNALVDFMVTRNAEGKATVGGVIIREGGSWRYCPNKIANTHDLAGWEIFSPVAVTGPAAEKV